MNNKTKIALVLALAMLSGPALANSPYAGEENRDIKALSKSQIEGLLSAKGLGYAKAAELNGYPGPMHVLELEDELSLTAEQRRETELAFSQVKTVGKELGARLVAAERALDEAFRNKAVDEASLAELVNNIGDIESRLRAVHLNAHLQQTKILTEQQIEKYMSLRGYAGVEHGGHHQHH